MRTMTHPRLGGSWGGGVKQICELNLGPGQGHISHVNISVTTSNLWRGTLSKYYLCKRLAEITCHRCCSRLVRPVHRPGRQMGGSHPGRVTGNVGRVVEGWVKEGLRGWVRGKILEGGEGRKGESMWFGGKGTERERDREETRDGV